LSGLSQHDLGAETDGDSIWDPPPIAPNEWTHTMKTLTDLVHRASRPAPWAEGDNIPWDDPEFSERMLAEHLSQDHDLASRRAASIDNHVEWIISSVLGGRPGRVLDLGCGPGFYSSRLANNGCECVGIDFSPASIRYARETAASDRAVCRYVHGDLREEDFGSGFDLVMLIYGQFNVFPRTAASRILKKVSAALAPGGRLLLELQSAEQIEAGGSTEPSWYSTASGLFSDRPHIVLQESFWSDGVSASTIRFMVIDAGRGAVSSYALSNEAYSDSELDAVLVGAGFEAIERFPSLSGREVDGETDLPVIVARR
jgi:SAM-dependent methyltransferase